MKNILDVTFDLLENQEAVSVEEIRKNITNNDLLKMKENQLEAIIVNDLMLDGRFLLIDGKWALKNNYTIKQIMNEKYKNLDVGDVEKEEEYSNETEEKEFIEEDYMENDLNSIENVDELI